VVPELQQQDQGSQEDLGDRQQVQGNTQLLGLKYLAIAQTTMTTQQL
jgi:hypothetical protein